MRTVLNRVTSLLFRLSPHCGSVLVISTHTVHDNIILNVSHRSCLIRLKDHIEGALNLIKKNNISPLEDQNKCESKSNLESSSIHISSDGEMSEEHSSAVSVDPFQERDLVCGEDLEMDLDDDDNDDGDICTGLFRNSF